MLLVLLGVLLLHLIILILLIVSTAASVSATFSLFCFVLFHFPTLQMCARGTSSEPCCCVYQTWTVGGEMSKDLWYKCLTANGGYHCKAASNEGSAAPSSRSADVPGIPASNFLLCVCVVPDWIQAVQALMILAVLFCFFSLIAFLYQLFRLVKGGRFFFTAIFQILASEYRHPPAFHTQRRRSRSPSILTPLLFPPTQACL